MRSNVMLSNDHRTGRFCEKMAVNKRISLRICEFMSHIIRALRALSALFVAKIVLISGENVVRSYNSEVCVE